MKKIFFTTNLMGGLGNQMFQIAHAYAQSKKHNVDLFFKSKSDTHLQGFDASKYVNNVYKKLSFNNDIKVDTIIHSEWKFNSILVNPNYSTEFRGYYQSSKNFYGYDDEIIEIFYPNENYLDKIKKIFPSISEENNVIIHIRRGDYLKFKEIHPSIDISYIKKCLSEIENYNKIFIVTDDKNWVKSNLDFECTIVEGLDDYEEMWLITQFPNVIMSNSTFSWWGSFLNKIPNKKIFVPSLWFGPKGEKHIEDLYEKDWIKINVNYENGKLININ